MIKYDLERFSDIEAECIPLFEKHYKEISHFQDIDLAPDLEQYRKLSDIGFLKCFTARSESSELIGYSFFFVKHNLHYKKSLQAVNDIIFIDKEKRGFGAEFIAWCDLQLKEIGCQVVYHHVKASKDWGPMIKRQGYELVDLIYAKRLDGGQ